MPDGDGLVLDVWGLVLDDGGLVCSWGSDSFTTAPAMTVFSLMQNWCGSFM